VAEPAFDELLRRLTDSDVDFVLIGGLALNAWGVIRGTKDLDIAADPDPENLNRLARVAVGVGGQVQTRDAFASTPFSIAALLATGQRVLIETEMGPLDVVQGLPGVPSYRDLREGAEEVPVLGSTVRVCSLEHLRKMKRAAARGQDLVDLESLEVAHPEE
jgi:predicted nucleotidyltransferase